MLYLAFQGAPNSIERSLAILQLDGYGRSSALRIQGRHVPAFLAKSRDCASQHPQNRVEERCLSTSVDSAHYHHISVDVKVVSPTKGTEAANIDASDSHTGSR